MQEFEVKFLEVDVDALVRMLEGLGAKKEFEGEIRPVFFDLPDNSMRVGGRILRLRMKGGYAELAFKQKHDSSGYKLADETEVIVSDFEAMRRILGLLGYNEFVRRPKHRITYSLGNVRFEFDTYKGFPTFLEIEASNLEDLNASVTLLGLDMKDAKPWSGRDVIDHYRK